MFGGGGSGGRVCVLGMGGSFWKLSMKDICIRINLTACFHHMVSGRQYQGMEWPGVRNVPEGSWRAGKNGGHWL